MTTAAQVSEKPIIFSAEMIAALMGDRKTQTRRIIQPQPYLDYLLPGHRVGEATAHWCIDHSKESQRWAWPKDEKPNVPARLCPFGQPGHTLWVRESFAFINNEAFGEVSYYQYRADTNGEDFPGNWPPEEKDNLERPRWRSSIHMPRKASRITLEITNVRIEQLQDISEEDAEAEGIDDTWLVKNHVGPPRVSEFRRLWERLHGEGAWALNPWVWCIAFQRIDR